MTGELLGLGDVVTIGYVRGRARRELLFGVANHIAERGIYLGVPVVQPHHCHADGCFFENLSEVLLARFQRGRALRNEAHFTDAA